MLNRRHLRVKVLQSLYAYYQTHNNDLDAGEKELLHGIDRIYDMYIFQLLLLAELLHHEEHMLEGNRLKHLPSFEDLNPSKRFLDNKCLLLIANDQELQKKAKRRGVSWQAQAELVRKLMSHVRKQKYYAEYLQSTQTSMDEDVRFVLKLLKKDILPFELLHSFYEEKSIYWLDDWELVNKMLIKTLKLSTESEGGLALMELFKERSDKVFARELFKITIMNHDEFNTIISGKTKNWDVERIALMDMIIMEMALTEILKFENIPVKVSLNEYIELSKMYSTPKSNIFVNGVLDKLVEEFAKDNKIKGYYPALQNKPLQ